MTGKIKKIVRRIQRKCPECKYDYGHAPSCMWGKSKK